MLLARILSAQEEELCPKEIQGTHYGEFYIEINVGDYSTNYGNIACQIVKGQVQCNGTVKSVYLSFPDVTDTVYHVDLILIANPSSTSKHTPVTVKAASRTDTTIIVEGYGNAKVNCVQTDSKVTLKIEIQEQ